MSKKILFLTIGLAISAAFFVNTQSVSAASITVTSGPTSYQKITIGQQINIAWTSQGTGNVYVILYNRDGDETYSVQLNNQYQNIGLVTNDYSQGIYYVRVQSIDDPFIWDDSEEFILYNVSDKTPPSPITNISVARKSSQEPPDKLEFSFVNPTDSDFYSIQVYRSTTQGQLGDLVLIDTDSSYYYGPREKASIDYSDIYIQDHPSGTVYFTFRSLDYAGNASNNIDQYFYSWDSSGAISVYSPTSLSSFKVGGAISMSWTMTGNVGPAGLTDIWLYKGNSKLTQIKPDSVTPSVANQYTWIIPSTLGITQSGSDYKIRVTSVDYPNIYGETGYFTIAPSAPASITLLSPNGGEVYNQNSILSITWQLSSLPNNTVYVHLYLDKPIDVGQQYTKEVSINCNGQYVTPVYAPSKSYSWGGKTVCLPDGVKTYTIPPGSYKIIARLYSLPNSNNPGVLIGSDSSDASFTIVAEPTCYPDGTLFKLPDDPKVYVIINCQKKWIQTAEEFKEEGYKWEDVKETSSPVLQAYNDYLQAISNLLRAIGQDRVYKLINGKLVWVPTISAFNAQGLKWSDIQDVSESNLNQYRQAKLLRKEGDQKIYYITNSGLKRHILNEQVFNSYNNNWNDVVTVSATELSAYPDNNLIKQEEGSKVYKLENGQKRWIKTAEAFNRLKYDWTKVAPANTTEINAYPEGTPIE